MVQISGDRSGHTVTVSHSPTLYVCRGKSPRGVRAKPSLSRDLGSMIEKIAFLHFMYLSSQILHRDLNIVSARLSVHSLNVMYTIIPLATLNRIRVALLTGSYTCTCVHVYTLLWEPCPHLLAGLRALDTDGPKEKAFKSWM